ncbi:MAG: hypothetical protein QM564_01840 [Bergeyella sp.]
MKNLMLIFSLIFSGTLSAQNVILSKVKKMSDNTDKIFYKINPSETEAEYLGELEIQGFSDNDEEVFGKIYKKAKEIGANAFSYQPFESIDGTTNNFDTSHYRLNLYYLPKDQFPKEENTIYIISSAAKSQKISLNNEIIELQPRTFTKRTLDFGVVYSLSTRKLLGSTIKLSAKQEQDVRYFQVSSAKIRTNQDGTPGINLKSGDIIALERSYGEFLTTIYQQIK